MTVTAPSSAARLRAAITEATGGLTASVGIGSSKMMAKMASEAAKPDGFRVVWPGEEEDFLAGLPVRALPGVGPATAERLATAPDSAVLTSTRRARHSPTMIRYITTENGRAVTVIRFCKPCSAFLPPAKRITTAMPAMQITQKI